MDDIMRASLAVSRDLITVTLNDTSIMTEEVHKLMALYHQISKVIGYPEHYGL
jgi:hypothetical protein